ncbi:MAG: glycosyltransferase [Candidatus Sumerlaeia bacterium]|nr:glycosyltransferase [Candidatus Sumerlaeia bacterium]
MKVFHIHTEQGWRGGEAQVLYLCEGLRKRNIESVVVTPSNSELHQQLISQGFCVYSFSSIKPINPFTILKLKKALRLEKPDLIHCHTAMAHTLALLATATGPSLPVIVSRRVDFPVAGNIFSKWKYHHPRLHYIAISEGVKRVLHEAGIANSRIDVVHSGIDPDKFGKIIKTRQELLLELNLPTQAIIVGNVAALTDHKGQRYLIEAAKIVTRAIPEVIFLIAGEGEERQNLELQIKRLGLEEKVRLLGFRQDIGDIMRLFQLFVLASHLEGLCTSILDALLLKIPVVATNVGGVPEIIKDHKTGLLVEPKNPALLAEAILYALQHPAEMKRMAERGYEFVLEHFTVDNMVRDTINVYHKILRL